MALNAKVYCHPQRLLTSRAPWQELEVAVIAHGSGVDGLNHQLIRAMTGDVFPGALGKMCASASQMWMPTSWSCRPSSPRSPSREQSASGDLLPSLEVPGECLSSLTSRS